MSMVSWIVLAAIVFALWRFGAPHVHRHGGWFLRIAFAAVLVYVVVVIVAPYAHAAEAKPWTACGSTVTWSVWPSPGTPETALAAISGAYAEVNAAGAGLTVMVASDGSPGTATTSWSWDNPGAGSVHAEGDGNDVNGMTNITARVHYHSQTGPSAGAALKTLVLKDIGRDLGLPTLQATGGHLTPADKSALKAACAAQKAQTSPAPSASSTAPGAPAVTAAPGGTTVDTPPTPATDTTTVTAGQKALGYTGALLGVIALALVLAGGQVRKLAAKAGVKRPAMPRIRRPHWLHRGTPKPSKTGE